MKIEKEKKKYDSSTKSESSMIVMDPTKETTIRPKIRN